MRKILVTLAAVTAILAAGTLTGDAQTSRAAASLPAQTQNFTPVEKAACGPRWGRWCRPFHHRVCGRRGCWCAPC